MMQVRDVQLLLWVLSNSIDIASIFGEVFTFEQRIDFEVHIHFNKFIKSNS